MTKNKLPVRFTGQHFTIDKVLIADSIKQAYINPNDTVLDIGAGIGFLTVHLIKKSKTVVAIEKDMELVKLLRRNFAATQNVQIVGCDFRNYLIPRFPFKVVSNIPYGLTSEILKILMFDHVESFLGGSIILQLEPAKKMFSDKVYNPLTVLYRSFYDLKLLYEVNPESFMPPPTVKSALLRIERKESSMNFKLKSKYLGFISYLLQKPDLLQKPELTVRTALKSIFRKNQIRSISEKFGIDLNARIVCLTASQYKNCFLEMVDNVPVKFHPYS